MVGVLCMLTRYLLKTQDAGKLHTHFRLHTMVKHLQSLNQNTISFHTKKGVTVITVFKLNENIKHLSQSQV